MNRATTLVVVIFAVMLSACAVDKPGDSLQLSQADLDAHKHIATERSAVFSPAEPLVVEATEPVAPEAAPVERDAKVATEEAARKILDVTLGAAALIKEAGLSAVQAVRDGAEPTAEAVGEPEESVIATN